MSNITVIIFAILNACIIVIAATNDVVVTGMVLCLFGYFLWMYTYV